MAAGFVQSLALARAMSCGLASGPKSATLVRSAGLAELGLCASLETGPANVAAVAMVAALRKSRRLVFSKGSSDMLISPPSARCQQVQIRQIHCCALQRAWPGCGSTRAGLMK